MDEQEKTDKDTSDKTTYFTKSTTKSQFLNSTMGEVVGLTTSIGAVYFADHLMPNQTKAITQKLAHNLGKWRNTSAKEELICARKMIDVTLLNIGGLANMGVQFAMHRNSHDDNQMPPLKHELGRLVAGRIAGTATAVGTLAFAQSNASSMIMKNQQQISKLLGGSAASSRFSELLVSDLIMSVGAIAGNAPAQLLYDKVVDSKHKALSH